VSDEALGKRVRARVLVRTVPYLLLLYFVAYLDRVNISYAALEMRHDLPLSDSQYGFGAGIFFFGYFLFEIPGTLLVETWSARKLIARILVGWGLVACAMAFIHTPRQFYWLRFLLGAAEAGFFPGVVVYLSHWFRVEDRARAFAFFMLAVPISNVVGAPVSGILLGVHWGGMAGWRWLFLLEGLPAIVLGIVTIFYLTDRPREARWLDAAEKEWLLAALARETATTPPAPERPDWGRLLRTVEAFAPRFSESARAVLQRDILFLVLAYFGIVTTSYGFSLWMPTVVKSLTGLSNLTVSLVAAVPYVAGGICQTAIGLSSDRTGERRVHTAVPMLMAALGMTIGVTSRAPALGLLALALVGAGIYGFMPAFWPMPRWFLSGAAAAAAVGLINSVGCLGGFVGPFLVGKLKSPTAGYGPGLTALGATATFAAVMVFLVRRPRRIAV
jgi:ACS family tartrate transporter-like MFS transporter